MHRQTGPEHVNARGGGEQSCATELHAEAERERRECRGQHDPVLLSEPRGPSMALLPEPELLRVLTGTGRAQTAVHQEHQRSQEQRAQRDCIPQEEPRTPATTKQSCTGERKQNKDYMFNLNIK